jgi:hypothetical protein
MPAPIVGAGGRVKRYQSFNLQVSPASFTDAGIFIDKETKTRRHILAGFRIHGWRRALQKKGY